MSRTAGPMRRGGAAAPHAGNRANLPCWRKARARLEQPDVAPLAPPVVRRGVNEPRQERGTQGVVLLRQRIADTDQRRAVREGLGRLLLDEREGHRLRQAARGEHVSHRAIAQRSRIRLRLRHSQRRERRRQAAVAVMTRDLLDQVHLAQHVDAKRRYADRPHGAGILLGWPGSACDVHIESQWLEDRRNVSVRDGDAKQSPNA